MMDDERGSDHFSEMLEDLKAGETSITEYTQELEAALPSSLLDSFALVSACIGRFAAGEITLEEAEKEVREQADLHPGHPFFFHMCMTYALQRGDELEADGYTALIRAKADRREEITGEDFIAGLDEVFTERLERIEQADRDPYSAFTYIYGGGEHLLKHLLVEEVLASEASLDPAVLELTLERSPQTTPVIIYTLQELLEEARPSDIPAGFVFLLRILGETRPIAALPVLLAGLDRCVSLPLHETVLALAKLGSAYPEQVSDALRRLVINPDKGETRLAAIEVLGMLQQQAGNLQFLMEELGRLGTEDDFHRDVFTFLVSAILSSSLREGYAAVDAALEEQRAYLDTRTIFLTMQYLKKRDRTKAGSLLANVLAEDVRDLLDLYPPPHIAAKRRTLTLAREDALREAMLGDLPDLSEVEERLRAKKDEPCTCGSGKKFRNCCQPRLLEMREMLLERGAERETGPDWGA
ncbi:MAG: SEC-C domain-containing protein [Actinomycetota bacterium]